MRLVVTIISLWLADSLRVGRVGSQFVNNVVNGQGEGIRLGQELHLGGQFQFQAKPLIQLVLSE